MTKLNTSTDRTPAERAAYYRDRANHEDLLADDAASQHDGRAAVWHRASADSFRTQREFILQAANGDPTAFRVDRATRLQRMHMGDDR